MRTAFPGNKISSALLASPSSQTALTYLSHFPAPNGYSSSVPGDYDNYAGSYISGINDNNYTARADYNIGSKDVVYFRYLHDTGYKVNNPGNLLAYNTSGIGVVLDKGLDEGDGPFHRVNTFQVHYVHTFNARLSNELNVSWMRAYNFSNLTSQISAFDTSWLPGLFTNSSSSMAGFTSFDKNLFSVANDANFAVNIGGGGLFGNDLSLGTDNAGEYWYQYVPIFQLTDNVQKLWGRHFLKAGFYMAHRYERDNDIIRSVTIDGGYTGMGPDISDGSGFNFLAEFETGFVSNMNQRTPATSGDASLYYGTPEYGGYVGDTWNATQKLTVTLGLRYDLPMPAYSVDNYWGVLDQTYPGWRFVMPGLTPGTNSHPFSADKKDLAPRVGMAYRLNEKTVIRSGYGIFYETGRFKFLDQVTWNSPAYGGTQYYSSNISNGPGGTGYTLANTFPAPISVARGTWPYPLGTDGGLMWTPGSQSTTSTVDQKTWTTPYMQRWSFDVQRQFRRIPPNHFMLAPFGADEAGLDGNFALAIVFHGALDHTGHAERRATFGWPRFAPLAARWIDGPVQRTQPASLGKRLIAHGRHHQQIARASRRDVRHADSFGALRDPASTITCCPPPARHGPITTWGYRLCRAGPRR